MASLNFHFRKIEAKYKQVQLFNVIVLNFKARITQHHLLYLCCIHRKNKSGLHSMKAVLVLVWRIADSNR